MVFQLFFVAVRVVTAYDVFVQYKSLQTVNYKRFRKVGMVEFCKGSTDLLLVSAKSTGSTESGLPALLTWTRFM